MIVVGGKTVGYICDISQNLSNIDLYKFFDLENITENGGTLATDEEYVDAEIALQKLYKVIMEGENE